MWQEEENMFFSLVQRPVGKFPRLNTKTQVTCRKYIDNLAQLSAEGKIYKCHRTIERLRKVKTDPDSQVSLRHAAALNAINEGNFERASRLLGEVEVLLPDTRNEDEHRLRWYHQKSLLKLQQGKHAAGIQLTEEALSLVSIMAPGCISAWLLINHAWFLTKIAADEDDVNDRQVLVKRAEKFYQQAMDHAESEYPTQMLYFQSRVPQYAKIGLAFLYLGCWQSVDNCRIGISTDLSWDDIRKAKDIVEEVQSEGSLHITPNTQAETVNKTTVQGDGNISVNAGKNSTIVINTSPPVSEDKHHSLRGKSGDQQPSKQLQFWSEDEQSAVPRPVCKSLRLNTKTQAACRKYIDNLAQLSAQGKIQKCRRTIAKLLKAKTDPDSQVSLRHAATLNAINEGDFKKANHLLGEVEILLPDVRNEAEHRLRWYHQKSLIKLREGKHAAGILLTNEALFLLDTVTPGCISAWLLINHAWFLTKIAVDEDDADDRKSLMKQAEKFYQQAIEHADREYPRQMPNFPQFAYIGLALLYLGCWQSVNNSRLGISTDVPLEDIKKAKDVIAAVDKEGPVCNVSKFLLTIAKACLQYRLSNHQEAYDLANEAKNFATEHSFSRFVDFADSIVQYLQNYVLRGMV
ncbi:PREDICTED: uncharacterized protein LOC109474951 [Branchiostoma belcheri]|uniref:Uncharacterized protein LOC109474951 n=1 Tax=Branchiostoma belcheri TaxID=7741 RepID=A0A6P4ZAT3_BRABE|nr:PREDICTED: uncharacterized protein LOC109474951 [Branchiostoma belcheri]